jgi:hypothetical protein
MFVSLLRKGTPDRDRSEAKLASAFDFVSWSAGVGSAIRVRELGTQERAQQSMSYQGCWVKKDGSLGWAGIR